MDNPVAPEWKGENQRRHTQNNVKIIREFLEPLLKIEYVVPSKATRFSNLHVVRQTRLLPDGTKEHTHKLTIDLREVNANSDTMKSAIPLPLEGAKSLCSNGNRYFMAFDLMKAYFQQPCSRAHSEARSFYAPGMGVFRFNDRIGLGDASAPGAFSIAMDNFLGPIRPAGYVNYFDDVSVGTVNAEDLPNLLKILVDRSIEVGATFKLSSLRIGNSYTHFAGLRCDNSGIHAPALQLGKLASLEIPSSKTELRSYMGVLNYLDKFLPPNVVLALKECVSPFLKKDQPESFDLSIHKEKFDKVHEALRNPLTLHDVKDDVQLIMSTDASQLGIGGVLNQENPKNPDEIYIIDL